MYLHCLLQSIKYLFTMNQNIYGQRVNTKDTKPENILL